MFLHKHATLEKSERFSRPQPGCHVTNQTLPGQWPGIIKFFPARENLASDIPVGDGKIANLFYSVSCHTLKWKVQIQRNL
jgi:hypothetical protein